MKVFSQKECQEWLNTKFSGDSSWEVVKINYPHNLTFKLPVDTGKKTALAHLLISFFGAKQQGLFWITQWGVFPSSENMALFDGYRKSLGETRAVGDAPGHVFDESDLPKIECLVELALYFYWDAIIFEGVEVAVKISHDECLSIYVRDKVLLHEFENTFARLKIEQVA